MGSTLSAEQTRFIESFATAPSLSTDELVAGVTLLEPVLAAAVADCALPPSSIDLFARLVDSLFLRAVEANRIAAAVDYARAQLDLVAATRANGGDPEAKLIGHAATATRFAQALVSLALSRHDGGLAAVSKLCGGVNEALRHAHGSAVLVIAQGIDTARPEGLRLLAETLLFVLTLSSTALYHPALPDPEERVSHGHDEELHPDTFIDAVVYHEDVALARVLASRLLAVVASWGMGQLAPQLQYKAGYQPHFFNLYNWFGLSNRGQRVDVAAAVAARATQLVGIYLTYKKPSHVAAGRVNAIVDNMRRLASDPEGDPALARPRGPQQLPGSMLSVLGPNTPAPSLFEIVVCLSRRIHDLPESAAILYSLLLYRKRAVMSVLCPAAGGGAGAGGDDTSLPSLGTINARVLSDLMEGLAHCAYDCVGSAGIAPLSFLVGTVLLLFSTESDLVVRLFNTKATAKWYTERFMGHIDAGSLLMTVVARTAARAVAQGNHDIAELNLGVLANMAPYVHHLHIVAGQRLATMLKHMLKRLMAAREAVTKDSTDYAASAAYKAVETHCCLTMDTMLGILDGSSRDNHSLLYDLLHQKPDIFTITAQFAPGTPIGDAAAPLAKLVSFYESELTSFSANTSVDDVMRVIRRIADDVSAPDIVVGTGASSRAHGHGGGDESTISACERNVFEYVEDDDAYDYFASLLWRTVLARSGSVLLLPASVVKATASPSASEAAAAAAGEAPAHGNLRLLDPPSREV